MTQGQLCDTLISFFRDELHVVDLHVSSLMKPETVVSVGAVCNLAQGEEPVGHWESRRAPSDPDPTEGVDGFKKSTEFDPPVWVRDKRADGSDFVRFATRVEQWNARFKIYTTSGIRTTTGTLHLDDSDMNKAARFLVELTRKLAAIPE
ncbi:hypothetical protein [Nocardia sp. NPDC051832]|uniref:hypothetical protein n=1 Tax=Nocardia sp. NPDC051832 TaxID=3155673 RepID=UPI00343E3097